MYLLHLLTLSFVLVSWVCTPHLIERGGQRGGKRGGREGRETLSSQSKLPHFEGAERALLSSALLADVAALGGGGGGAEREEQRERERNSLTWKPPPHSCLPASALLSDLPSLCLPAGPPLSPPPLLPLAFDTSPSAPRVAPPGSYPGYVDTHTHTNTHTHTCSTGSVSWVCGNTHTNTHMLYRLRILGMWTHIYTHIHTHTHTYACSTGSKLSNPVTKPQEVSCC
jgi:hypothetical protein